MQLKDLVRPLDSLSDDELMARLREVRHRRETIRPAAKKYVERAEVKAVRARTSSVDKLLENMTEAEREELIAKLSKEEAE